MEGSGRTPIESSGVSLKKSTVVNVDGGRYVCKCMPDGQECLFNVSSEYYNILPSFQYYQERINAILLVLHTCHVVVAVVHV